MRGKKEIIVLPKVAGPKLPAFLAQLKAEGVETVHADPARLKGTGLLSMHGSPLADSVILDGPRAEAPAGRGRRAKGGRRVGGRFVVLSNADIDSMLERARGGLDFVVVEVKDWKIIPLENTVSRLHDTGTLLFAWARSPAEVRKMFSVLDVGVDGVILEASSVGQVRESMALMGSASYPLEPATVTEVREVGAGERVCVDTASMLGPGEGMLVGSRSNFMFLVHNESIGSQFLLPRPFRVNAGAVHSYTLGPDGDTRYLSEVEAGSEILVVDPKGRARRATVGRSKIESRPMVMIKAAAGGEVGGIIAQDAETIRLVRPGGDPVSVTRLKKGDKVVAYSRPAVGRHSGTAVPDEYILEK